MSKKNKTKKKQQRNLRNIRNLRNQNKTHTKRRKQRGGSFYDFIPSPFIDTTRNILTGFQNFKNQLYGLPLDPSRTPFVQPYRQI